MGTLKVNVLQHLPGIEPGLREIEEKKLPYLIKRGLVELIPGETSRMQSVFDDGRETAIAIAKHLELEISEEEETIASILKKVASYFNLDLADETSPPENSPAQTEFSGEVSDTGQVPEQVPTETKVPLEEIKSFRSELEVYLSQDVVDNLIKAEIDSPESLDMASNAQLQEAGLTEAEMEIVRHVQFTK